MRPEIESAVMVSVDLVAGFFVLGVAWWLFSIFQNGGPMAGTKPVADTLTGAQPGDDSAQAGDANVVTAAQLAAAGSARNPGYYNPAVF